MSYNEYPKETVYAVPVQPGQGEYVKGVPIAGTEGEYVATGVPVMESPATRNAFINKVYSVLFCQLLATLGMTMIFTRVDSVKEYVQTHPGALWAAIILSFVIIIGISCSKTLCRQSPYNYIALSLFTLVEGYLVGTVASFYDTDAVDMAVIITAFVTGALTIYARSTSTDFTGMGGYLIAALFCLIGFGLCLAIFCPGGCQVAQAVYGGLGALIFSIYLVHDTQAIVGGRKYSLTTDEHIFGALMLYLDIINLFLFILSLLGGGGSSKSSDNN